MYKIIIELMPSGCFGLPQDNCIVWPAGPFEIKILEDSVSSIIFKVSKYREKSKAIGLENKDVEYKFNISDNYIIFYCDKVTPMKALEFCQEKINTFIRILQFRQQRFFNYKFVEIYYNNSLIPLPSSGEVKGLTLVFYNLDKLKEHLRYSMQIINLNNKIALRFLDYFDRATFLENIYGSQIEKFLNDRTLNFLLPEIFLNYYKSISIIVGDPSIDNDYQKRYKELGFNEDFFKNTLEVLRNIRNDKDVSHYSLNDDLKIYDEINAALPRIKEVACEVFDRYLNTLDFPKTNQIL